MKSTHLIAFLMVAATSALAQDATAEAVGTGIGFLIGLGITIVVGAVVGWIASLIVKGSGTGFWGDVLIGIGGSVLAGFLFPLLGVQIGTGLVSALVPAVIGAVILLLIIRLIRRSSG